MSKFIKDTLFKMKEKILVKQHLGALPGTTAWLIATEIKYGGLVSKVPRQKVSPKDPRTKKQLQRGGMIGGDRMAYHGYAEAYSEYLLPIIQQQEPVTLAEFGILKGTGLATWCELFKKGEILGFDIDLGHTKGNMENLKSLGAFAENQPELHEFDQLMDGSENLEKVLQDRRINICIDDGLHLDESILNTMSSVQPYLAKKFIYFIEDNATVSNKIRSIYPNYHVDSRGELTIVTNR